MAGSDKVQSWNWLENQDSEDIRDWVTSMREKGVYWEYYCTVTRQFYFYNEETGHETLEEPDERFYRIIRYTSAEVSPFLEADPEAPQCSQAAPPNTKVSQTSDDEFQVIPEIVSRETSAVSVASLSEMQSSVELNNPYKCLLSHLRGTPAPVQEFNSWGSEGDERTPESSEQEGGLCSRCISITGEIPALVPSWERDQEGIDLQPPISPLIPKWRKFMKWGLVCGILGLGVLLIWETVRRADVSVEMSIAGL